MTARSLSKTLRLNTRDVGVAVVILPETNLHKLTISIIVTSSLD